MDLEDFAGAPDLGVFGAGGAAVNLVFGGGEAFGGFTGAVR